MAHIRRSLPLLALALTFLLPARADVVLPALFADHMVMQRGVPIHVWGSAAPAESVTISLRGATRSATADDIGQWSAYLPPSPAGGPFELTVRAANTVTIRDVMVGEVWIASGQSNMEFPVKGGFNAEAEIASANQAKIRVFHVNNKTAVAPLADVDSRTWETSSPQTAGRFSAVAHFFARDLVERLNVPVGIIESSWGGTPVEAWMSLRALSSNASYMPAFGLWWEQIKDQPVHQLRRRKQVKEWEQAVAKAKAEGKQPPGYPWEENLENSWMPGGLYNAMIAPLTPYPIGGVIWYQGESNTPAERAPLYASMFQTMIRDWRGAWGVGDFPFLFVQLANFKTKNGAGWPVVREAQSQTLSLARTGMAVTIDIGDPEDIHPRNKQEVGRRLALAARAIAYGESVEYSGPIFRQAIPEGGTMRVWFDHAARGFTAKGTTLKGFEIAGADHQFVAADARIDDRTLVVSSTSVPHPLYVRYGWADSPECNLYNAEGLPASPFRSE